MEYVSDRARIYTSDRMSEYMSDTECQIECHNICEIECLVWDIVLYVVYLIRQYRLGYHDV